MCMYVTFMCFSQINGSTGKKGKINIVCDKNRLFCKMETSVKQRHLSEVWTFLFLKSEGDL